MTVRLAFLGGLAGAGIGRNCMTIEDGKDIIVVDCGLHFPRVRMDGIEVAIPDLTYILRNRDRVSGLFLTHGHEDHIGAIQYLAPHLACPIYGSELTLALARRRLDEVHTDDSRLRPVADGATVRTPSMQIEFIPVAHSVPMSNALAIHTSAGVILHSGDLKLDPDPLDGRRTDLRRFQAIGTDPGVRLLLLDSTNAEEPGATESERAVHPALSQAFAEATGRRVIATCFASHLHRISQLTDVARSANRVIVPVGRSMERSFSIGRELGILRLSDSDIADVRDLHDLPAGSTCVICTGSQGEPRAALSLMSERRHRFVELSASDMVIMSSDAIPGNESEVNRMIDNLTRTGAEVVHAGFAKVHVSGHAKRDELREILQRIHPQGFIPIHGEYRHLTHLIALAKESFPCPRDVLLCQDGDIVEIMPDSLSVVGKCSAKYVYVAGGEISDINRQIIAKRESLFYSGVVAITLARSPDPTGALRIIGMQQFGWLPDERFTQFSDEASQRLFDTVPDYQVSVPEGMGFERLVVRQLARLARKSFGSEPQFVITVLPPDET